MIRNTLLSIVAAASVISASALAATAGKMAPDFTGVDSNGVSHKLSDFKGKTVVLEWTNHDCPYVKKHYGSGNMQALQQSATEDGVVWLTVVSSAPGKQGYTTPEQANALVKEKGAKATARILDSSGEIGSMYKAKTTPHMFVIDDAGMVAYAGAIDSNSSSNPATIKGATNYVTAALDALEAGKPVEVSSTVPYGCSVKY